MDVTTVRKNLVELNERMAQLRAEEQVVRNLIVGFEGWLRLNAANGKATIKGDQKVPVAVGQSRARSKLEAKLAGVAHHAKGTISMNRAVLQVVEQAHGQPLRTAEIVERAVAMGARTDAQHPERVVDLLLYSHRDRGHKPVERVDTMTWRWKKVAR